MNRWNVILASLVAAAASLSSALAPAVAAPLKILGLSYGGSGCPANSTRVELSPNGRQLKILSDEFKAVGNDPAQSRKSCNISIPIKVPAGYQVALSDTEFRGYVARGTKATLRSEYFFAGQRGPVFQRNLKGPTNYVVFDRPSKFADVWSACGESVNMRVNTSITASGDGIATVDSLKLGRRGLVYQFKYRTCR